MKIIFLVVSTVFSVLLTHAQSVQGIVYEKSNDSTQVPLPGVNVYWLGTNTGTQTNAEGRFSIPLKDGFKKLIFSYVGFISDTIDYKINNISVFLVPGTKIGEVVVKSESNSFYKKMATVQVQQINSGELRKAACCNLSESFSTNASVDVNYSDAISGAKQIELLGLAGKYGQIMIEKIPTVRGLSSNYGLSYIPGTWMEAIQVSKGTASVVDGFESTTGQINVELKKPFKGEKFLFNYFSTIDGKMDINSNIRFILNDKWTTSILAHGEQYTNTHDMNHDGFIDMPGIKQYNIANAWSYDNNKNLEAKFGFKALGERRWGGQNGFDGKRSTISDSKYSFLVETNKQEVYAKVGWMFAREGTSLGFIQNLSSIDQKGIYGLRTYDARQQSLYSNLIYESYLGTLFHKYNAGVSLIADKYNETYNLLPSENTEYTPGTFFQYTYTHSDKFVLMAGIRADYSSHYGLFFTPRTHLKYNITENFIVRLSAGKGYRSPHALLENTNLLVSSMSIILPNELQLENAWNYGLTVSKDLKIFGKKTHLYAEYFRTDFIHQLITDFDQSSSKAVISNIHKQSYSNNYQIEASISPIKRMELLVAYRKSDVKAIYNGAIRQRPLVNTYKALATTSYITNMKKWQFDFTSQFNGGGRLPDTYINPANQKQGGNFESYTIINAQITKNFKKWGVYIGAENLLNFKQQNPILGYDNPFGSTFNSALIWGPIEGRLFYGGLRVILGEFFDQN